MEEELAGIEAAANEWLLENSPSGRPFVVTGIAYHSGMVNIVIDSPAAALGNVAPKDIEEGLEEVLQEAYPDAVFMVSGAQRENTKSKLRRDPERGG